MNVEEQARRFRENVEALRREIAKAIVGHEEVVRQTIVAILAEGHALLEGVPGIGKTLLVRTVAQCLRLRFSRIQFTPDLMPADILGTNIVVEDAQGRKHFEFQKGPVFGNIVLADEINRATPKTQSALLEAMQEKAVTVAGVRYPLEEPFFVLATQNPIEMEGTYPLPEAQVDRFLFKIEVPASRLEELLEVIDRTTGRETPQPQPVLAGPDILEMRAFAREVPIASHVKEFAARLVLATHPSEGSPVARKYLRYGASPRGAQALVRAGKILALMKGRYNVSFGDIREAAFPALRHRLILNFEAEAEGIRPDAILEKILAELPEVAAAR
ncbi:MAG TPA: MoxR family ATPase [Planctomycetota bacterium]|nr:MoxR family ATPase [Planctomycetota bacterium]